MSEAKSPLSKEPKEQSTAAQWVAAHESQEPIEMAEQIREALDTISCAMWCDRAAEMRGYGALLNLVMIETARLSVKLEGEGARA